MIILLNVLKRIFRKWGNVLLMLILPTIICFAVLYISFADEKYKVGIVDLDQTFLTSDFCTYMEKESNVTMLGTDSDVSNQLLNEGYNCIFVLKRGFTEAFGTNEGQNIQYYYQNESNYSNPVLTRAQSFFESAGQLKHSSGRDRKKFEHAMSEFMEQKSMVKYRYAGKSGIENMDATSKALGYIAFCLITLMVSSTSLIMEDKRSGVLQRLWSSPMNRASYYVQHILAYLFISFLQLLIVFTVLPLVMDVSFGTTLKSKAVIMLISVCFSFTCISMGVAINKYAKNKVTVSSLNALVVLPMMMLGGCFWPRDIMPDILQKIAEFMPTTWFFKLVDSVVYTGGILGAKQYIGYLCGLSLVILVLTFVPKYARQNE